MATTKVSGNLVDLSSDTGALSWAAGTTAQRPGSASAGDLRFNSTESSFEVYTGSEWHVLNYA